MPDDTDELMRIAERIGTNGWPINAECLQNIAVRLSALQARNAELERDARRYRWLRTRTHVDIAACWLFSDNDPPVTPLELDAAIDAALSQEPTRQGEG